MKRLKVYVLFLSLLFLPIFISGETTPPKITKPDSNFKSIHQYQWEAYAESTRTDTTSSETTEKENFFSKNRKNSSNVSKHKKQVANVFLISGIALLLLSGGAVIFILLNRPKNTS